MIESNEAISQLYVPGSEVLLKCKVKHVGGNYLILEVDQIPTLRSAEVVVLKENVGRMKVPETPTTIELFRFKEFSPSPLKIRSFASLAVVNQIDKNGNLTAHQWLQDLTENVTINNRK